jgi:hypothetical protein
MGERMMADPKFKNFMEYCGAYPQFIPALDILWQVILKPGFRQDIHDDNVMMRGPVLVLADPVFERNALMTRR